VPFSLLFPTVECSDNLFTQRTGMITSPDYPNPYPKSSECFYNIELEEGFMISLQFEDIFDIEDHPEVACPYDYIKVSLQWALVLGTLNNLGRTRKINIRLLTFSQDRGPSNWLSKMSLFKITFTSFIRSNVEIFPNLEPASLGTRIV
jgi:hypothetical protein